MAESQLECMEDGRIGENIPESRPEFYYSETHRAALEELVTNGDDAFKTLLRKDNATDFLSAREIQAIQSTVEQYSTHEDSGAATAQKHANDSTSLRSTYWPEMSDTELPPLDIGWPNTGFFKGVTRVMVHAHPPKDNGPHIKEVVRRLIQEAQKVIAIVMDQLTDLQILHDLLDAASRRNVAVYIILENKGGPDFIEMCRRLKVGPQHLQNIRTRILRGVGLNLSCGRIPGSLSSKYMLIDGDKVMFGSYSFSWSSARMDRNIITIMTGQIVDFFDWDFRELYAMSRELNLFKEFSISKRNTTPSLRVTTPTRPTLPTTSRFQVSLGDKGTLKIPAHKYHNPKYLLALGKLPEDINSPHSLISKMEESIKKFAAEGNIEEEGDEMQESESQNLPPSKERIGEGGSNSSGVPVKKKKFSLLEKAKQKGSSKIEVVEVSEEDPGPLTTTRLTSSTNTKENITEKTNKKRKSRQKEVQGSESRKGSKKNCVIS